MLSAPGLIEEDYRETFASREPQNIGALLTLSEARVVRNREREVLRSIMISTLSPNVVPEVMQQVAAGIIYGDKIYSVLEGTTSFKIESVDVYRKEKIAEMGAIGQRARSTQSSCRGAAPVVHTAGVGDRQAARGRQED